MTDDSALPTVVKLMPDWGNGPLWVAINGGISDPYDTDEVTEVMSISDELRDDIAAWDDRFQRTLNEEDPANSRFPTADAQTVFIQDGRRLAHRLRGELPADVIVEYGTGDGVTWRIDETDQTA
jgi:hypothetical protein